MAEYMSDDERLSRLRDWWSRNGAATVVGVVLAIVAVIGWQWYQRYATGQLSTAATCMPTLLPASSALEAADSCASPISWHLVKGSSPGPATPLNSVRGSRPRCSSLTSPAI